MTELASTSIPLHRHSEVQIDLVNECLPVLMRFGCFDELVSMVFSSFELSLRLVHEFHGIFFSVTAHPHISRNILLSSLPGIEVKFDGTIEEWSSEMKERFRNEAEGVEIWLLEINDDLFL